MTSETSDRIFVTATVFKLDDDLGDRSVFKNSSGL